MKKKEKKKRKMKNKNKIYENICSLMWYLSELKLLIRFPSMVLLSFIVH